MWIFLVALALWGGQSARLTSAQALNDGELLDRAIESADAEEWLDVVKYLFAYSSREPHAMREDPEFAQEIERSLTTAEANVAFQFGGVAGAGGKADGMAGESPVKVEIPTPEEDSMRSESPDRNLEPRVRDHRDDRLEVSCEVRIHSTLNADACMHKKLPGWENGNLVHLWECDAGPKANKVWVFEPGTGLIRSAVNPAVCLHKKHANWENGNPIHLWDCDAGGPEMKTWQYDKSNGLIRSAVNPEVCMHKKRSGWEDGNPVHLWDCDAGSPEHKSWQFESYY